MATRPDLTNLQSFLEKVYADVFPPEEYPHFINAAFRHDKLGDVVWELYLQASRCSNTFGYRPPYNLSRHRDQRSLLLGHLAVVTRNDTILEIIIQASNGGMDLTLIRETQQLFLSNWHDVRSCIDVQYKDAFDADVQCGSGEILTTQALQNLMTYVGMPVADNYQRSPLSKQAMDCAAKAHVFREVLNSITVMRISE